MIKVDPLIMIKICIVMNMAIEKRELPGGIISESLCIRVL